MLLIKGKRFAQERALYNLRDAAVEECRVEGAEDGESLLKECGNVAVNNCYFDLRYPMWHATDLSLSGCEMTVNCRAPLWYDKGVSISDCRLYGVKALRESSDIDIVNSDINSPEFCWNCKNVGVKGGKIVAEYAFFGSRNIRVENLDFEGKYSFQYAKEVAISNSRLKTKDAFWHTHGVTVTDSVLDGEYLGWYSSGLTLIRCHISGTQPLCYCKGLELIDCTMDDCDLAFEYSDVKANISGSIMSVKNPLKGRIVADSFGEIILKDPKYPCKAKIIARQQDRESK